MSGGTPLRRLLASPPVLRGLSALGGHPFTRPLVMAGEVRLLQSMLARTREAGPEGAALGALFARHEPDRTARAIYDDVFSSARVSHGYQSQMGQDLFLDRWVFRGGGPGFFVDVGAFDGVLGSNTWFFEQHRRWDGLAIEPHPEAFAKLSAARRCQAVQACAYDRDGEVQFLALSEAGTRDRAAGVAPPQTLTQLLLDPRHGATMLSGIDAHIDNRERVDLARETWQLEGAVIPVPCRRIDSLLRARQVGTVDYLSIDVEGAELQVLQGIDFDTVQVNVIGVERSRCFPDVYRLLTAAGFEYHGLLFFDEIFVHRTPRFTWTR